MRHLSTPSLKHVKSIEPTIKLSAQQIAQFHERGYLTLPEITSPEEVSLFRIIFQRLFAERVGRREGAQFDMITHDEDDQPARLPTIINPVNFASELRATRYRANALAIARQLLGPEVTASFEHVILKPAREGAATPWHQDEATRVDPNFVYQQLSIWMPLQEATIENGCMHYIPGSHWGEVLAHRSPNSDPKIHAIECAGGFDPASAVACPLPAGGATIHQGRTLHYAGPNLTDTPRFAYILAFEVPPTPLAGGRDFYWNRDKQTANLQRKRIWWRHGGIVIELVRKMKNGTINNPKRVLFEVRRALRALLK